MREREEERERRERESGGRKGAREGARGSGRERGARERGSGARERGRNDDAEADTEVLVDVRRASAPSSTVLVGAVGLPALAVDARPLDHRFCGARAVVLASARRSSGDVGGRRLVHAEEAVGHPESLPACRLNRIG